MYIHTHTNTQHTHTQTSVIHNFGKPRTPALAALCARFLAVVRILQKKNSLHQPIEGIQGHMKHRGLKGKCRRIWRALVSRGCP